MIPIRRILMVFALAIPVSAFSIASNDSGARHLRLIRSAPAADTTVTAMPAALDLWFSEPPEVRVTTVRMTMPGGTAVALKEITQDEADASHIIASIDAADAIPGAYVMAWRTMSSDGHIVSGELSFRLRPAR